MGRKENDIDNLDLNLETDFNLDLDLDENKDLVFPEGNEYFKNEDSRKYRLNTKSVLFRHAEEGARRPIRRWRPLRNLWFAIR